MQSVADRVKRQVNVTCPLKAVRHMAGWSWYNRAVVEHVMGFCATSEYREFMEQNPGLEQALVDTGIHLVKFWFSVSRAEQRTRFTIRVIDPLRQWKPCPVDLAALDRWDDYTHARRSCFGEQTLHEAATQPDEACGTQDP